MYKNLKLIINMYYILLDNSCCIYSLLLCLIKNYLYTNKHICINYVNFFLHTPNFILIKLLVMHMHVHIVSEMSNAHAHTI